jgi:1-phosphatidylinositol phosphodiesterase
LKHEHTAEENTVSKLNTLDFYLRGRTRFLQTNNREITLDQARGKFIIMSDNADFDSRGLDYGSSDIQDEYNLSHNWDLYKKWLKVKNHLYKAQRGDGKTFYINYLSGASLFVRPYFVASGHITPGTSAPRLSTGVISIWYLKKAYPDFPRVSCQLGLCTIAFEGTNILARDHIKHYNGGRQKRTVGIIVADFPGEDLIHEIIRNNWILKHK